MKFSFFLPFDRFILETPLTPADIRQRLMMNVEDRKQFKFSFVREERTKPYEGEVSTFSFDISRIIRNRNSFLPEIRGAISPMQGMTHIKITMMPHIFIFTGMLIMLGLVVVFCLGFVFAAVEQVKKKRSNRSWATAHVCDNDGWILRHRNNCLPGRSARLEKLSHGTLAG